VSLVVTHSVDARPPWSPSPATFSSDLAVKFVFNASKFVYNASKFDFNASKLVFDSKLKPKREKLTLLRFYYLKGWKKLILALEKRLRR
jgi:hypothetical protein